MRAAHPSCHRNDAWNKAPQNRPISPCKSQRRKGYTYKSQIAITLLERKHQMLTLQPSVRHETVPIGGNRHRGILGMTEIFRQSMAQVLYKTIGQTVPRHQSQHNHTKTKLFIAKCSRKRPHSREFRLSYFFSTKKRGTKRSFLFCCSEHHVNFPYAGIRRAYTHSLRLSALRYIAPMRHRLTRHSYSFFSIQKPLNILTALNIICRMGIYAYICAI